MQYNWCIVNFSGNELVSNRMLTFYVKSLVQIRLNKNITTDLGILMKYN